MRVGRLVEAKGSTVHTVSPADTLQTAAASMERLGIGSLVALDGDDSFLGLVTEADVVAAFARHGADAVRMRVGDVMRREVPHCDVYDTLEHAMAIMTDHRTRHLPVFAGTVLTGVLSIGDVVKRRLVELKTESLLADNFLMWSR